MPMAYRMTKHAMQRMRQRRINPWHILTALSKAGNRDGDGRTYHYHYPSRTVVVTDPTDAVIVTVYKTGTGNGLRHSLGRDD